MAKKKANSNVFEIAASQFEGIRLLFDHIDELATERLVQTVLRARRIFVTGRGRSRLLTGWFAIRLMQMGFDVHVPDEVTCPRIKKDDLLLAISCSGTTTTTVDLARIARESGAKIVAVTAIAESVLAASADDVVMLPVMDKDIERCYKYGIGPCNNTLFEQALVLYFDSIIYSMIEREGISKKQISKRHTNLE
ncbi:6-phospho-3-hexuloisomerase [Planctomycetota bacterium]